MAKGDKEVAISPPDEEKAAKRKELRERAAALPWDPEHLRAFLAELVDAL